MRPIVLAIHGGAGTILKTDIRPDQEAAYEQGLAEALEKGYTVLEKNGTAIDAVLAATRSLEDCILFNAGRGSVFAKDGSQEMDASIMDGSNLEAGAVSAVKNIRNPIDLAYAVMKHTPHVLLNGNGANEFANSIGIAKESDEYFFSTFRYEQWKAVQFSDLVALDHNVQIGTLSAAVANKKFGTVGAVACDGNGNIAAATSTGGMTNKQWGRVGDSSIIGAGNYANNKTCAISCTGHGELFIKAVAAYDVSCLMEYKNLSLEEAMKIVVHERLMQLQAEGGMIGVDAQGNAALHFNSEGMYRGVRSSSGRNEIAIYK